MGIKTTRPAKRIYQSTFTYFIPSPPNRKNGYREIEFDKITRGIMEMGFELETIQSQSCDTGIFIICVLSTKSKKIFETDVSQEIHERFRLSHTHSSPDIILDEEEDV